MPFGAGTLAYIGLDNAAGAVQNVSGFADNFSWPQPVEMLDVSVFGTNSKAFIPGLADGAEVSMSGPLHTTLATQLMNMKGTQQAGGSTFSLLYGPLGSVSGNPKVTAEVYVKQFEFSTGVAGRVEYSSSLQVTGAVTNGTW